MSNIHNGASGLKSTVAGGEGGIKIDNSWEVADMSAPMNPCPIRSAWIIEGNPIARMNALSRSRDGTSMTVIWDCTAGKFNWIYGIDETTYFLEGSFRLKDSSGSRLIKAGDSVFFPAGSRAEWTVDSYIRKVAFLRAPLPGPLASARRIFQRARQVVRGQRKAPSVQDMFGSN